MSSRNRAIVRYDTESNQTNGSSNRRLNTTACESAGDESELNREQLDRIVSDGVKYVLISDHKKLPIKRSDLLKAILKNSLSRKTHEIIIKKISSSLRKSFAIDLKECPETVNSFILVNNLSIDGINESVDCDSIPEQQHYRSALLTTVLALIFMSGQSIHEQLMWKFLAKLGFDVNSKQQTLQISGESGITVKKLLTELWVRQLYLKYQKIPRSEPIAHEFKWGFRAEQEFSKMNIIKFVCSVYGDNSEPNYWRTQYQIAINELNELNGVEQQTDIETIED